MRLDDNNATANHDLDRRLALLLLGAGALSVTGCATAAPKVTVQPPNSAGKMADMHCHLFNESDLPAIRFIQVVFLGLRRDDKKSFFGPENPDVLDGLMWLFIRFLAGKAPTARAEADVLAGIRLKAAGLVGSDTEEKLDTDFDEDVARFLQDDSHPIDEPKSETNAKNAARIAILRASGNPFGRTFTKMTAPSAVAVAAKARSSSGTVGVYLRWFRLFRSYRYQLTDKLLKIHSDQGFQPLLMAPAMIDYSRWLQETPRSPLGDQVDVFSEIAMRPGPTAIHGYVAFDPLHQLYFEKDVVPSGMGGAQEEIEKRESPLAIVERALTKGGFIGVKLYPPMGFSASGNSDYKDFPREVLSQLTMTPFELGTELDRVLNELYALCTRPDVDAPVLAHGGEGNEAREHYGLRAGPRPWLNVLKTHPTLRVCLAHFGGFGYPSTVIGKPPEWRDEVWESILGHYVQGNPNTMLYADVAYLDEIMGRSPAEQAPYVANFKKYAELDPKFEHLLFGTDWAMLGNQKYADSFTTTVRDFLIRCGLEPGEAEMENIMWRNARRFAGLTASDVTRHRLDSFYRANNLDASRLTVFD